MLRSSSLNIIFLLFSAFIEIFEILLSVISLITSDFIYVLFLSSSFFTSLIFFLLIVVLEAFFSLLYILLKNNDLL